MPFTRNNRLSFRSWVFLVFASLSTASCHHRSTPRCSPEQAIPAAAGRSERTWTPTSSGGIIEGHIEDMATAAPLNDVTVALPGTAAQVATTAASGEFRFTGLSPGRYVVLVFGRYPEVRDTVIVANDRGARGRLRLEPSHLSYDWVLEVR